MDCRRYLVFNKTRKTFLSGRVEPANSLFKRMKGLIGRPSENFPSGSGLWLLPCDGIHTFGMRFPIDAVYLDSNLQVVRLYHRIKPFRVAALMFKARSVLELPSGTLELTQTKVGDQLEFREPTIP